MRRSRLHLLVLGLFVWFAACDKAPSRPTPTPQPGNPVPATPPAPTPTPTPTPTPNNAPTVRVRASASHSEIEQELLLTASVTDDVTPAAQLQYQWTATAGTFNGAGPNVRWRAPKADKTPVLHTITVTVTENYTGPNGPAQHVVSATTNPIAVNNSRKELSDLAGEFLTDFSRSANSPQFCTRNFSSKCGPGLRAEIKDITANRQKYVILDRTITVNKVEITGGSALVTTRCRFVSRIKATGATEIAIGDSLITGIYDKDHWALCDSRWRPLNPAAIGFLQ